MCIALLLLTAKLQLRLHHDLQTESYGIVNDSQFVIVC